MEGGVSVTSYERQKLAMVLTLAYMEAFPETIQKDEPNTEIPVFYDFTKDFFAKAKIARMWVDTEDDGNRLVLQRANAETAAHNIAQAVTSRFVSEYKELTFDSELPSKVEDVTNIYKTTYDTAYKALTKE